MEFIYANVYYGETQTHREEKWIWIISYAYFASANFTLCHRIMTCTSGFAETWDGLEKLAAWCLLCFSCENFLEWCSVPHVSTVLFTQIPKIQFPWCTEIAKYILFEIQHKPRCVFCHQCENGNYLFISKSRSASTNIRSSLSYFVHDEYAKLVISCIIYRSLRWGEFDLLRAFTLKLGRIERGSKARATPAPNEAIATECNNHNVFDVTGEMVNVERWTNPYSEVRTNSILFRALMALIGSQAVNSRKRPSSSESQKKKKKKTRVD